MLATPPLAGLAYRLSRSHSSDVTGLEYAGLAASSTTIVIVGFGGVGRRVGEILEIRDIPYAAVDSEANIVKQGRNAGHPVFYGDAQQPDVLKSLGVGRATLMIVTIDDFRVAERVVSSVHREYPRLEILVRGRDKEHCQSLQELGARFAVSENLEASIALAHAALIKAAGNDVENDLAIDRFRAAYYSDTRVNALKRTAESTEP